MKLRKAAYTNFRGILERNEISFNDSNVFVGRNDAGKSTILRGLDLFINNAGASPEISNGLSSSEKCVIELSFEGPFVEITIDESIPTTLDDEELLDEIGHLRIKREWDTTKSNIKPDTYVWRKVYEENDFLLKTEAQLITQCRASGIETQKANGEEFNNREKRLKLREHLNITNALFSYKWEKLPSTGNTRAKSIHDQIKSLLPKFEYFRADTSLSETEASIQRYFRGIAAQAMKQAGIEHMESAIDFALTEVMSTITNKINSVLPEGDKIEPLLNFDWSKVVQTGFKSSNNQAEVPLSFRGDGFRRITMMSYFEHLAEESLDSQDSAIFAFEEPETFLHPKAQEQLHEKLIALMESGYQVIVTTHSPIIVAASDRASISHVCHDQNGYKVDQSIEDFKHLADDLGITPENQFIKLFEKAKVLVLVEGPDDVRAFTFIAKCYRDNGKIEQTFEDQEIVLVPIGGCDSVNHWVNLNILRDIGKPFYIIQDSDRSSAQEASPTHETLTNLNLVETDDFWVLEKRALENYLNKTALVRLIPGLEIEYDDFTRIKPLCANHDSAVALGGKKVVDKHFCSQTFDELENSFKSTDGEDEFLNMYNAILKKL